MDDDIAAVLSAPPLPTGTARRWFELVTTTYRRLADSGAGEDWPRFAALLTTAAAEEFFAPEVAEAFLAAAAGGGMALVGRLCALGGELPVRYDQLRSVRSAPDDVEPAAVDPWQRLVSRHGPDWAGWDGSEAGWVRYRDWFYTVADQFDHDAYAEAYHRLHGLDDKAPRERIERLREWGFTVTATAPEPVAPPPPKAGWLRRVVRGR